MQTWLKISLLGMMTVSALPLVNASTEAPQYAAYDVPALPQIRPADKGQSALSFTQANNDEISEAIDALSHQAQVKEDALAKLAAQLEEKHDEYEQTQEALALSRRGILAALPVDGYRVSSNYGHRTIFGKSQFHKGIDLAAPAGSPVYATGPGVVTRAGWVRGYGQFVEIDHGAGLISRYGHNSKLHVRVGDRVSMRQRIADVGCTGRCTGPHVHYEVLKNGQHSDPNIHLAMASR